MEWQELYIAIAGIGVRDEDKVADWPDVREGTDDLSTSIAQCDRDGVNERFDLREESRREAESPYEDLEL